MKINRHTKAYAVPYLRKVLYGDEVYPIKTIIFHVNDLKNELVCAEEEVNLFQKIIFSITYSVGIVILYIPSLMVSNIRKLYVINYIKRKGIKDYLLKIINSKEG